MIVPCARLILWVAIVVLPAAALGGVLPALYSTALAFIALFLVVTAIDAALGFGGLKGIEVLLPPVVRLNKDRPADLEIRIKNETQRPRGIRLGLPLPREFAASQEDTQVHLPAQALWSRLSWPCTPLRRGNFRLNTCHLETCSPLGFWAVRTVATVQSELRVYPNLRRERNSAAALFLNRGAFGIHLQRQVGKARDFEQLREYLPGDGYEDIHWKATAKRGHPVTKIFQLERTQEVYVVIDASRLSARLAPDGSTLLERFISAGLVLGLAAGQQGDLFGLITFNDRIAQFVRAKTGQSHYNTCRDAIYALQPRLVTPDFDELATFVRLRLRRRALLIFLTSLDDPVLAESFVRAVDLIRRQHVIVVNMMQVPEIVPMFSGAPVVSLDDIYRHLGGHILWNTLRGLEKTLQRRGVRFSLLQDERLSAQLITQYLTVKRRQLL
ncbi:MAG TPA: DUF58 domain-containing protein [Candidatus Saccharimonadales bacterium]|nr:DUF58 domain-containing protein [Candidatus Saccharimonadales bacterium]